MACREWQRSNVVDEAQRVEYQKPCDATLKETLDLGQVYEDQDAGFYVRRGVERGVARRFISDIQRWAEVFISAYDAGGQC